MMGVPDQQAKKLVQKRSAILLLLDAGFFILSSLPDIVFGWLNILESRSQLQDKLTTGYLELVITSRIVFSMSNSVFYIIIGTCRKGACK